MAGAATERVGCGSRPGEFQVSLPLLARGSLHSGADTYGFLTAAMGIGAVVGLFSAAFMATGNTTLQLTADLRFRSRVMAL